jgi:hypothetical protein
VTSKERNQDTSIIPPVPATPPEGLDPEAYGLREIHRIDDSVVYDVARPYADDSQGQPPVRRPRHDRSQGTPWWVLLILAAAVVGLGWLVYEGTDKVLNDAFADQRTLTTQTLMDRHYARVNDANHAATCAQIKRAEWRNGAIDDWFIHISRVAPDGVGLDRAAVAAYLDRICKERQR